MVGAVGPLTHAVVDSNGVIYLTNNGPVVYAPTWGATNLTNLTHLRGIPGASPRVFPFWADLLSSGADWSVTVDTSVAGRFKVVWNAVRLYMGNPGPFSFSAAL